jgi:hypothetical protein
MTASRGPSKDSPLERFEARAQHVFDWIGAHPRQVLGGIGGAVLLGLLVTGIYEWNERRQDAAHEALAKVERRFAEEFAGDPRVAILPEPANADQARRAREDALAGFLAVADAHSGSRAADFAQLRAAEMEVDLGQLDAAEQRLLDLDLQLGRSDSLRAVALRLGLPGRGRDRCVPGFSDALACGRAELRARRRRRSGGAGLPGGARERSRAGRARGRARADRAPRERELPRSGGGGRGGAGARGDAYELSSDNVHSVK